MLVGWRLTPFALCWEKFYALESILGSDGNHSGLGDENICICREVLILLLFAAVDSQWQAWVDVFIEPCNVVVNVGLADISVSV